MKVKISDILPNPHRDFERLPLDLQHVALLKDSIQHAPDGYWGGIVVRKAPKKKGKYELAFGHHRLEALKDLGYKEIEVLVKSFDDTDMLRVMITENDSQKKATTEEILETVKLAKEHLDKFVKASDTLEDFVKVIKKFFNQSDLDGLKNQDWSMMKNGVMQHGTFRIGVGTTLLHRFLRGNFNPQHITQALDTIRNEDDLYDVEAVKLFTVASHAERFKKKMKQYCKTISKDDQYDVAEEVINRLEDEGKVTAEGISKCVDEYVDPPPVRNEDYSAAYDNYRKILISSMESGAVNGKAIFEDLEQLTDLVEDSRRAK